MVIMINTTIYLFRISKSKTIHWAGAQKCNQKGDVITAIT